MTFQKATYRWCRRQSPLRSAILLSVLVWQFVVVSGLVLYLHLSSVEGEHEHDSGHCTICKDLVLAPKDCLAAPLGSPVHVTQTSTPFVHVIHTVCVETIYGWTFAARPPPEVRI